MADTLAKLARLRRLETEAAKRDLSAAVNNERLAQRALIQAQAAVALEARVTLPATPGAFAAWLPAAAQSIARCKAAEVDAARERTAAREALAHRLTAQKAAETALDTRNEEARIETNRRQERSRDVAQRKE